MKPTSVARRPSFISGMARERSELDWGHAERRRPAQQQRLVDFRLVPLQTRLENEIAM